MVIRILLKQWKLELLAFENRFARLVGDKHETFLKSPPRVLKNTVKLKQWMFAIILFENKLRLTNKTVTT